MLLIFSIGMLLIIFEARLHLDKFKPAMLMLSSFLLIGLYYYFSGDDPHRFESFIEMQKENKVELFSLIAFMAFMWMMVEILSERGVFSALNSYLISRGMKATGMFWSTGLLAALLSPSRNRCSILSVLTLTCSSPTVYSKPKAGTASEPRTGAHTPA